MLTTTKDIVQGQMKMGKIMGANLELSYEMAAEFSKIQQSI